MAAGPHGEEEASGRDEDGRKGFSEREGDTWAGLGRLRGSRPQVALRSAWGRGRFPAFERPVPQTAVALRGAGLRARASHG